MRDIDAASHSITRPNPAKTSLARRSGLLLPFRREKSGLSGVSQQVLTCGCGSAVLRRGGRQKRYGAASIFSMRTALMPFLSITTPFTLTDFSMKGINSAFACL